MGTSDAKSHELSGHSEKRLTQVTRPKSLQPPARELGMELVSFQIGGSVQADAPLSEFVNCTR